MKRFIAIAILLLVGASVVEAQTVSGVTVDSFSMERAGEYVVVDMDIDIRDLDVKGGQAVVLTPHIVRDTLSVALKSIGIYGRNRDFYYQRNQDLSPTQGDDLAFRNSKAPEFVLTLR